MNRRGERLFVALWEVGWLTFGLGLAENLHIIGSKASLLGLAFALIGAGLFALVPSDIR